jgi:hypothetical protein
VVLRKKLAVLLATVMMLGVMSAAPALAHHDVDHHNKGNKANDLFGTDHNQGGGQEHTKNARPPHGGGEQHGGGDQHGGGCEIC